MRRVLVPVAVLLLLASGCGGVDNEPNLAKAVERTEATGSARLELSVRETLGGMTFQGTCEGIFDYAGKRSRLRCAFRDAGSFEIVELGSVTYSREELTAGSSEPWSRMPTDQDSAVSLVSPESLLTLLRSASRGTERIGEEDVRGEASVRYRMIVNCDEARIGECQGETAPVDVWIDDVGLVRGIEVDEAGVAATIEFFDFGVEVDIEAPPADKVEELGEGWTGYGPPQDPNTAPCSEREATPISENRALEALHRQGFRVRTDRSGYCLAGVAAVMANAHREDALEREGILHCFLSEKPEDGAPKTVVRRGVDGGDAEFLLANLTCMILADSPRAEEKIRPLEQAFEELERAIRP